jgi:hypothetical protein
MKGFILSNIPSICDDMHIIACLNLYGNVVSYARIPNGGALVVYDPPLRVPFPIVWCHDYRLSLAVANVPEHMLLPPPLPPWRVADQVKSESRRFRYAIEYFVTGYPVDMPLDILRIEIIVRFGHYITLEHKKRFCFVYFDRYVKPADATYRIEISQYCKRKFERETEVCMLCDGFNPTNYDICILCHQRPSRCISCKRHNLPNFKYCGYCGIKQIGGSKSAANSHS